MGRGLRFVRSHAIAFAALFAALAGGAYAAGGGFVGAGGAIGGCVKHNGLLQIVKPGKGCLHGTRSLRFNEAGQPGPRGLQGRTGNAGLQGNPGVGLTGDTVVSETPAWELTGTESTNIFEKQLSGWDQFYYNSATTSTIQLMPLTVSQVGGVSTPLKSIKFCYGEAGGASGAGIDRVTVQAVTQPDSITAASTSNPPGGTSSPNVIDQTESFGSQGCPTVSATSPTTLTSSEYLVVTLYWKTTSPNTAYQYLYLGHVTFTFGP
jgi:hypothetical protein